MKPNRYSMQGFLPPLLDGSRQSARTLSFKARQKRQQQRSHIGRYDDAGVVRSYGQQAFSGRQEDDPSATGSAHPKHQKPAHYKNKRKHNHMTAPTSFDIVRSARKDRAASLPGGQQPPLSRSGAPHRFMEPKSRNHP